MKPAYHFDHLDIRLEVRENIANIVVLSSPFATLTLKIASNLSLHVIIYTLKAILTG